MTAALLASHLSKAYGGLAVTRDVSLAVAPGEIHAVIGPNGAGKTTLIAQIFGEVRPDHGSVLLAGHSLDGLPTHARARAGLARTFQITSLDPSLSPRDHLLLALLRRIGHAFRPFTRYDRDARLNAEAGRQLQAGGLLRQAEEPVGRLSHGEQRLLELILALVGAPKVVLLDEPLAGLGSEESRTVAARIKGLKGSLAVLLVEHDMVAVFALADTVSVLVRGQIIASGPPDMVRRDPAVKAAYLGEEA